MRQIRQLPYNIGFITEKFITPAGYGRSFLLQNNGLCGNISCVKNDMFQVYLRNMTNTKEKGEINMLKTLKKTVVLALACALILTGTLFTQPVSAATGPSNYDQEMAKKLTIGEAKEGTLLGTSTQETKSTYYKIKTKHTYDLVFTVEAENDCSKQVEVLVWNSKGVLLRNGSSSKANWKYDKDANKSKDEFTVKKKKAGTYYIEIRESGSTEGRQYTVRGTVKLRAKVQNVVAKQQAAGGKKVTVTWTPIKDDAVNIQGYKVYRAYKKHGKYKLVATVKGADTKTAEVKSALGKKAYFIVKAYYFSKNSDKNLFSKASAKYLLEMK